MDPNDMSPGHDANRLPNDDPTNPVVRTGSSEPDSANFEKDAPRNEEASKDESVNAPDAEPSSPVHDQESGNADVYSSSPAMPPPRRVPAVSRHAYVSEEKDEETAQDDTSNNLNNPEDPAIPRPGVPLGREFFERLQNEERMKKPRLTQAEKERVLAESLDAIKAIRDKTIPRSMNPASSPAAASTVASLSSRGSTLPDYVTTADEEDPHFTQVREAYEKKKAQGGTSTLEELEFLKAQDNEKKRKQRIAREIQQDTVEDDRDFQRAGDENLFLSDEEETGYDPEELDRQNQQRLRDSGALNSKGIPTRKPARQQFRSGPIISRRMMNESLNVGMQGFEEQKAAKKKGRGKQSKGPDGHRRKATTANAKSKRKRGNKADDSDPSGPPKKRGRKSNGTVAAAGIVEDLGSVVGSNARRAGPQPENNPSSANPQILSTRKKEALMKMILDVPTESQRISRMAVNALDEATKKLNWPRRIRPDPENNGWRMTGMTSALENFQLIGLARMRELERREVNPRGGIIADEMGLGKTVSMIANIVDGRPSEDDQIQPTLIVVPSSICKQWQEEVAKHTGGTTFKKVMIYKSQFNKMVESAEDVLQNMDIVITTYYELRKSWPTAMPPPHLSDEAQVAWLKKQHEEDRGPLHRVMWLRVVLDECQQVKNAVAQTATAACGLFARHRWLMSGTIVTNDISEFYSFFKFLKVPFLGRRELFMQNFISDKKAQNRLRELLKTIMIRRTHNDQFLEKPLVELPSTDQRTIKVTFTAFERAMYDIIYRACRRKVSRYMKSKGVKVHTIFIHILQLLLLLRQLTGHLFTCIDTLGKCLEPHDMPFLHELCDAEDPDGSSDAVNEVRAIFRELEPEVEEESKTRAALLKKDLVKHYKENGFLRSYRKLKEPEGESVDYVCSNCNNPLEKIWKARCDHLFCNDCLETIKEATDEANQTPATCPATSCQVLLDDVRAISRRALQKELAEKAWDPAKFFHSAKTQKVQDLVNGWLEHDPQTKIIIFSQFLEMVEVLGIVCQRQRWAYCKYTGNMTMDARNSTIETFKKESEKRILIMSLKAGGVGLNLNEATKVILVDLFWNEAVEQQAKARVHRIGQKKPTELLRLTAENSMDQRLVSLQDRKTEEMTRVLNGDAKADGATMKQLLELFEFGTTGENGLPNGFMLPDDGVDEIVDGAQDETLDG